METATETPTQKEDMEAHKREVAKRAFWASFFGSMLGRTVWYFVGFLWTKSTE